VTDAAVTSLMFVVNMLFIASNMDLICHGSNGTDVEQLREMEAPFKVSPVATGTWIHVPTFQAAL
jgi:hypothetical protein